MDTLRPASLRSRGIERVWGALIISRSASLGSHGTVLMGAYVFRTCSDHKSRSASLGSQGTVLMGANVFKTCSDLKIVPLL
jgi:hypothetical protein